MRIAHIDWSSDGTIFLVSIFVLAIVLAVLLERVSPKRKRRRRVGRGGKTVENRAGELID